jgi:hypothetical protein
VVVVLLVASIPSYHLIPFLEPFGADFRNLFAFHHCAARNHPYSSSGFACGDPWGRGMVYPPLLYWCFAWVRLFSFEVARNMWCTGIVVLLAPLFACWTTREERQAVGRVEVLGFWALCLAQFPVAFAVERGNSDVLPVVAWSLAAIAFRRAPFVSGALAAAATMIKLYPAFACVVVSVGLIADAVRSRSWRRTLLFGAGVLVTTATVVATDFEQTRFYLTVRLPEFNRTPPTAATWAHAVPAHASPRGAAVIGAVLLLVWCAAAVRRLARDPLLIFAGGLAIATYFGVVSYDYNLITTYPLLLVLFTRAALDPRPRFRWPWALLVLGVIAVVGHRRLFDTPGLIRAHVELQLAWLAAVGAWACVAPNPSRTC